MTRPQISKSITSTSGRNRRAWLFKRSRPLIRRYEPKDNGFLWSAYLNKSFDMPDGLSQADFMVCLAKAFGGFNLLWIVEDDNLNFRAGRGQVGIVGIKTDGWTYEPNVKFFRWATNKNKLRAAVGFFQMIRYQKDIGCCLVRVGREDSRYLYHLQKYGVLYPRGRIPLGSPKGDLYMFSINGMKNGD